CGPFGMLGDARTVLAEFDVPKEKIHFELFYVDEPPPEVVHADKVVEGATSEVTVILDGRRTTSAMSQGKTILDSAQEARSDVPFACKGGLCGTCRAKFCGGEVDMVRTYALDDAEVAANFVLTCQTFPVSDEVTVDYDSWPTDHPEPAPLHRGEPCPRHSSWTDCALPSAATAVFWPISAPTTSSPRRCGPSSTEQESTPATSTR